MKSNDLHPNYFPEVTVTCSCGAEYTTGSTKEDLRVEICKECHPFFTGEQRIVDTEGRVERLKRRYNLS
jgi:large subunit ribosomal protein L31